MALKEKDTKPDKAYWLWAEELEPKPEDRLFVPVVIQGESKDSISFTQSLQSTAAKKTLEDLDYVWFTEFEILAETTKALLITGKCGPKELEFTEVWFPVSQCKYDVEANTLKVTKWIVQQKLIKDGRD